MIRSSFLKGARWLGALAIVGGCAPGGTRPHEMSVAGHQAAAQREDANAGTHHALYNPSVAESYERCSGGPAASKLSGYVDNCWIALRNPTDAHVRMAEQHRSLAEKHRAAAQTLVGVEARACVGVSEYDRDVSPFAHREDIATVAPILDQALGSRGGPLVERTRGARITFHDVPGLTAERLQTIVDCHLARNAVLGHDSPEMLDCPLVPKDVTAQVGQTESGHLTVDVRAEDLVTGQEIWRRVQRLTQTSPLSSK